jgi:hypothetical protein
VGAEENVLTKRVEVTGGWRKLHNEELHNLYSLLSIIRITKSRRMRLAGRVVRMGEETTRSSCNIIACPG